MKKVLSVLLACLLLLSTLPLAFAEDVPQIIVSVAKAIPGDTVTLTVSLKNNPGVAGVQCSITYDPNVLTLSQAKEGASFSGMVFPPSLSKIPYEPNWTVGTYNVDSDGVFVSLTFEVASDCVPGTYPVSLTYVSDNVFNASLTNVAFEVVQGAVEVTNGVEANDLSDFSYELADSEITIKGYQGTSSRVIIGSSYEIEGTVYPVTSIAESAVEENETIESLVIPETVRSIGDYAFYDCTSLTSITVLGADTEIGEKALCYYFISRKLDGIVEGVTIYGYEDSTAQAYAETEEEITFVALIQEEHIHDFSVLQFDETNHWYKCATCDEITEKAAHSGGTATCTTLAKCMVCQQEYGELASHDYNVVQYNDTEHWYKCANCEAITEKTAHSGGTATCTTLAICTGCGKEYGQLATHVFDVLQYDEEYHWNKCANCDATTAKEAHSGGNASCIAKPKCESCGMEYGTVLTHVFSILQSDESGHWYKCANCSATTEKEAHSGGSATCTEKAKCERCGTEYGNYATHVFCVLKFDATDHWYKCANCTATTEKEAHSGGTATCTAKAKCEVCDTEYGEFADHSYTVILSDATDHWYKCTGCDLTTEKVAHSGGTATCTAKAKCEVCDTEYGEFEPHSFTVRQSDATDHWYKCANCTATTDKEAHSGGIATCTAKAKCEECDTEYGELEPHSFTGRQSDATDHWYKCANCTATTEKEAHSGGTATCTAKAKCEVCDAEYGEFEPHSFTVRQFDATDHWYKCANCTATTEKEAHFGGNATCTAKAKCEVCDSEYGEFADHSYTVIQSDATDHWYKCTGCDLTTEKVAHSGGTATCTAKAKCEVCDTEYGEFEPHSFTVRQSDATDHWYKCANCTATTEKAAHSGGIATCTAKAKCEVCDTEYGELEPHSFTVRQSDATDHWYKCANCTATREKAAHSGGTATCTAKAKCEVCDTEYGEFEPHSFTVRQFDATDHWYKCANCTAMTDKAAHSGGTATCTAKAQCVVCEAEYGEYADHDYSVLQSDATDHWYKCANCTVTTEKEAHFGGTATCAAKAACEVCGTEYGGFGDHSYVVPQSDETEHWYKCVSCDLTTEKQAHFGGVATCTEKAKCEICDTSYGELEPHDYSVLQFDATDHWYKCANCTATTEKEAHSGGTATCTAKANCEICDTAYGELEPHDYTVLQFDETGHWYKCANCDAVNEKIGHKGGTATCTAKAECEVCGTVYGELAAHNFTNYISNQDATCTSDGTKTAKCDNCDATDTTTDDGSATGHVDNDDDGICDVCSADLTPENTCAYCGEVHEGFFGKVVQFFHSIFQKVRNLFRGESDCHIHSYDKTVTEPTCTEQGYTTHTCKKCGKTYVDEYTDALGHIFGEWITDVEPTCVSEGHQYRVCERCNEKEEQVVAKSATHTDADGDGMCDLCGATGVCKYCYKVHSGLFGGLTQAIHDVFYKIKSILKIK